MRDIRILAELMEKMTHNPSQENLDYIMNITACFGLACFFFRCWLWCVCVLFHLSQARLRLLNFHHSD